MGEVVVDGSFDGAQRVSWLLMQIDADFAEDVVCDVVHGVIGDDLFSHQGSGTSCSLSGEDLVGVSPCSNLG